MTAASVTVLLPVHNGARYVASAVESILGQSYGDFELLVIDDGSTDATPDILRGFADPRIRLLRNDANLGLIATLNRGIAEARGELIARMDADDVSLPQRLEGQARFLDKHSEVGVVGSAIELIDADGRVGARHAFPERDLLIRWALCFMSPIVHPTVMFRADVVRRLGGYSADALHCEDYELWWRAASMTQFANLPGVLLRLRKHGDNVTARHAATHDAHVVRVAERAMSAWLGEPVPAGVMAALQGRRPGTEEDVRGAVQVLFAHARKCLALAAPEEDRELLRQDLRRRLLDWLDDPALDDGARRRVPRILRRLPLAAGGRLQLGERGLVCRLGGARALRLAGGAAWRASRRALHAA